MTQSVSFDCAADTYDATRALPEAVARKQTDVLLAELEAAGASRLLEVGIGTGRIARPVAARGVPVVGVDIAPRMLARLREQIAPTSAPVGLALGDATRLPIATASVRAVLVVHVLHLVSDWRATLGEIARVLEPGGVFLHDATVYGEDNPWTKLFAKRAELLGAMGFVPRRRPSPEEIASELERLGATQRIEIYAEEEEREPARDVLDRARRRVDSWTWEIPEAIFEPFFSQFEAYVEEELGSLDAERATGVRYTLEVWTFSGT